MSSPPSTDWRSISKVLLTGAAAAIMLAKGSAGAPSLQVALQLQLTEIGWLMSISYLATALLGVVSGQLSARFSAPRIVKIGLLVMIAASLASLFASHFYAILAGRAIEGIGVILVVVAAPSWMIHLARDQDRTMAMGVWALWLPAGSVTIMLLSPLLLASGGWRALWLLSGVVATLAWLLIRKPEPATGQSNRGEFDLKALTDFAPWLLALIFGCFSFQFFSVFTFLPLYFADQLQMTVPQAATMISIIPLMLIPGNMFGGLLAKRGIPAWQLMAIPALILIGLSQLLFSLNNSGLFTYLVLGSYGFFLGIVPTAIFVQVPRLAASTSAIAPIIGLTMSGQGIGVLLGPPLTGWVAAGGSQWQNCATLLSAVLVLLIFTAMTLAVATRKQLLVPQ